MHVEAFSKRVRLCNLAQSDQMVKVRVDFLLHGALRALDIGTGHCQHTATYPEKGHSTDMNYGEEHVRSFYKLTKHIMALKGEYSLFNALFQVFNTDAEHGTLNLQSFLKQIILSIGRKST